METFQDCGGVGLRNGVGKGIRVVREARLDVVQGEDRSAASTNPTL